jgi:hypothetical protein
MDEEKYTLDDILKRKKLTLDEVIKVIRAWNCDNEHNTQFYGSFFSYDPDKEGDDFEKEWRAVAFGDKDLIIEDMEQFAKHLKEDEEHKNDKFLDF